mmetsp:Transcript_17310/g.43454  ORF Transcript_17310/g.43454 Transcript_17310/m.43454 type:complete len:289 (-) Transcript_17310:618-1484(-)
MAAASPPAPWPQARHPLQVSVQLVVLQALQGQGRWAWQHLCRQAGLQAARSLCLAVQRHRGPRACALQAQTAQQAQQGVSLAPALGAMTAATCLGWGQAQLVAPLRAQALRPAAAASRLTAQAQVGLVCLHLRPGPRAARATCHWFWQHTARASQAAAWLARRPHTAPASQQAWGQSVRAAAAVGLVSWAAGPCARSLRGRWPATQAGRSLLAGRPGCRSALSWVWGSLRTAGRCLGRARRLGEQAQCRQACARAAACCPQTPSHASEHRAVTSSGLAHSTSPGQAVG